MRKIALILAAILTLNLTAPAASAYAAPAMEEENVEVGNVFDEETVSDNELLEDAEIVSATLESEQVEVEAEETDLTAPIVLENEPSVSENEPSVSENEPSVSGNEPSVSGNEPSVSGNEPSVSGNEPSVSENEPSVSENAITDLYVTEKYYRTQNGYPLVGIIKVPYFLSWDEANATQFLFRELKVSVDDGEAKELRVTKSNQYKYGHDFDNETSDGFYVLFNAGYDDSITEGTHKLTYTGIVTDGIKEFPFEVSAEAEFANDDEYYLESANSKMQYMSAYKGSLVKMIYSSVILEEGDEEITGVALLNQETQEEYECEILYKYDYRKQSAIGPYKGFVGFAEGDYLSIFNQDFYGYNFYSSIQLKEEIPEGDYDLVYTSSTGNRNILPGRYRATKKPVVLGLYQNSIKEKSSTIDFYKTGFPIYTNNSGDYVSVFVYGLNLTKDNVPVFYNADRTATVTEYTEEGLCGYEEWEYGFDFTVKKTGDVSISFNEVNIPAKVTGDVIYADNWSSNIIDESEVALRYYPSLIDRSEYNVSAQTLRYYLTPGYVKTDDVIHISTSYYSSGENYEATVDYDGKEYYIEIDKDTPLYQNYMTYNTLIFRINEETDKSYYYGRYHSMYDFEDVKYIDNIKVPANCSWEVHDVTAVSDALYSGKNGGTAKNVLTTAQVNALKQEGLCRVCIYDKTGKVSERYLAYFTNEPLYKITYVLNGGENNTENPLQYTKNQEVVLKDPSYECNSFLGWYSDEKCTKKVTKIAKGSTGDKTFYAKWRENQYSVTYYPNGASGEPITKTYPYNFNIVFPQKLFTYPGYKLAGWTENADGSGTFYELSYSIPALSKEDGAQFEVYAKWEPAHYSIVLEKGSDSSDITDGTIEWFNNRFEVAYDDVFMLSGNEFIYPGHKLIGWKTDSGKKISNGEVSRLSAEEGGVVTLYAQWEIEKYKITYNYNGGKVKKANPKTYTYETPQKALSIPTKKGYTFVEYLLFNEESLETTPITAIGGGQTGDLNVFASYRPNLYTVVLKETQDSLEEIGRVDLNYDSEYTFECPSTLTKAGYTLTAWSTKPNGKGTKYLLNKSYKNLTAKDGKVITLYPCWTKDSYSITYNLDGGKNNKKNPKKYSVDTKTIELKTPTKTGYTFKGWYVTKPDGVLLGDVMKTIEKGSTGNLVLTAVWEQNSYMLKLHPNTTKYVSEETLAQHPYYEGSFAYEDRVKISDLQASSIYAPTEEYENQGYGILYWSTKKDGSGKKYYQEEVYSKLKTEGTLELYAKWGMTPYAVTYVGTEGIKNQNPATYTYHKDNVITLKSVAKKGYIFGGWYTTPSYEEESVITEISCSLRQDITLYAKFTPVTYKIVLAPNASDAEAGVGEKEFTKAYDEAFTINADAYTKEHYKIAYWTTKANGKGTKVYSDVEKAWNLASKETTVTLYPKWQLIPYSITYNNVSFTGEKVINKSPVSYTYNATKNVNLKNPIRTGYVFGGWYNEDTTAPDFDVTTSMKITKIAKCTGGNIELYALWTPITYKVKFEGNGKNVVINEEQNTEVGVTYGEPTFVPSVYSRKGYNLLGFNTKKNGKGTMYTTDNNHMIYATKANSTVKLYAIWEKVTPQKLAWVELSADLGSVRVSFGKNEGCDCYEVALSEYFTMTTPLTQETYSDAVTFSGLQGGKRYFVRVREIRTDSQGNRVRGPWSNLLNITITE